MAFQSRITKTVLITLYVMTFHDTTTDSRDLIFLDVSFQQVDLCTRFYFEEIL